MRSSSEHEVEPSPGLAFERPLSELRAEHARAADAESVAPLAG